MRKLNKKAKNNDCSKKRSTLTISEVREILIQLNNELKTTKNKPLIERKIAVMEKELANLKSM